MRVGGRLGRIWSSTTARGRWCALLGLILLALGASWSYPFLAGAGACLVLLLAAELLSVLRAPRLQVRRAVAPHVVLRNGQCQGTLHISGSRAGALARVEAFDLVDDDPVPVPLSAGSRALAASVTYQVPTLRRGLMTVGPAVFRRRGLTGLAARHDTAGGTTEVRVLPQRVPLSGIPSGHRRATMGGDDSAEQGGTDLVGLHEYAMGEDLRRLHWATSARTGTLMVREDAEPSEAHVLVLLDDRAESYVSAEVTDLVDGEPFEEAVELTAALCRAAVEAGSPLRFRTASERFEMQIPGSATREPRREARELEWLLAEVQLVERAHIPRATLVDLDLAVVVTGTHADRRELAATMGHAPTRVLAVVDPTPTVMTADEGGALVLRGRSSQELALAWDVGVRP